MQATTAERGRFITLEGPDGAGKSLQAARLAALLRDRGHAVVATREPGGTSLGERIRDVLLATGDGERTAESDALLFNAARAELARHVIRPALARGETVICDRFSASTLAYQGYGAGLDIEGLRALEAFATGGLEPDLVLLLDLPVDVGLARRAAGSAIELTRFEQSAAHGMAFHERVREGYLELARAELGRWRIVDASADPDSVEAAIASVVIDAMGESEPEGASLRISS